MEISSAETLLAPGTTEVRGRPALEEEEDRNTRIKTRRILLLGLAFFPLLVPVDVAIGRYLEPSQWGPLVAVRLGGMLLLAATLALVHSAGVTGQRLLKLERVTTPCIAISLVLPAALAGGVSSIYGLNVAMVLCARAAMRSDPWKQALPSVAAAVLAHPLILAAAALVSPRIAAQWLDPAALTTHLAYLTLNVTIALLILVAGQTSYSLRHQLHEARQIGRYQLRRRIGSGGMGEVWAAFFPALRREVAIKIIRKADAGAVARFEREVRATSELTHPNTVRVFDFGHTEDGLWYYTMELLEGESVAGLVRREGALSPARARHLTLQAAQALAEAHARGIVHRDVKPENLFVTAMGGQPDFLKVLDFGIAKVAPGIAGTSHTTTGFIQGTPGFIAPEVIRGEPADERADVYGLGAVAYAMLTGSTPFSGDNTVALLEQTLSGHIEPPSQRVQTAIPRELEEVVMRCLEREPDRRFRSAAEVAAALAALPAG
jgi:eukaryotic-like serine/threonine-protein kinase